MEEAQAQGRAEQALKQDAISNRWWLNRMKEIRWNADMPKGRISEEGNTEVQLKELERLRRCEEIIGQWLRKKGLLKGGSPKNRVG
jgi:hypothetical protein